MLHRVRSIRGLSHFTYSNCLKISMILQYKELLSMGENPRVGFRGKRDMMSLANRVTGLDFPHLGRLINYSRVDQPEAARHDL